MFDPIESLLPHRAPLRFIDALTACTDTSASATARFGTGHFAVADGTVLAAALVECVAQTAAAALGQRAKNRGAASGAANHGMLVSVTDFQIHSHAPVEKALTIAIRDLKRFGPLLMIAGQISCEDQVIAAGVLTLYA